MPDALSSADLEQPQAELLPDRTVMSLLSFSGSNAGAAGAGGTGQGGFGINLYNCSPGGQVNISSRGFNGHPGSARHG
jgi:hypothetical protein